MEGSDFVFLYFTYLDLADGQEYYYSMYENLALKVFFVVVEIELVLLGYSTIREQLQTETM